MKYNPVTLYKPRKDLQIPNTLPREPMEVKHKILEVYVKAYIDIIIKKH